jgi:hypothetical protein
MHDAHCRLQGLHTAVDSYDLAVQEQRFAYDFFEFGRSGQVHSREQVICKEHDGFLSDTLRPAHVRGD